LTKFCQNKSIGCEAFKSIAADTLLTEATASERERERGTKLMATHVYRSL
jgi:hypothetical protein